MCGRHRTKTDNTSSATRDVSVAGRSPPLVSSRWRLWGRQAAGGSPPRELLCCRLRTHMRRTFRMVPYGLTNSGSQSYVYVRGNFALSLAGMSHTMTGRPRCIDCGASAPETNTNYTLISSTFGWRLTRRLLTDGTRAVEWRCPACWRAHQNARQGAREPEHLDRAVGESASAPPISAPRRR